MELSVVSIEEIKILSNVKLIHRRDLNHVSSSDNLHVQFQLSGDLRGTVTCYLCLDGHELAPTDKNFIFPLFTEAMNILVGKQMSTDPVLKTSAVRLSPPKLSMIAKEIQSQSRASLQFYTLELDGFIFSILTDYSIEAVS